MYLFTTVMWQLSLTPTHRAKAKACIAIFGALGQAPFARDTVQKQRACPRLAAPLGATHMSSMSGGALACVVAAFSVGGGVMVLAYIGLCAYAQSQLLMSDYVQHYGLTRARDANGKHVPVAAQHSWNSPHWFSSAMLLNATRHSDHHAHPTRHYPALTIPDQAPMLPRPLPLMASIALVPPLWRKIMDPRVDRWRNA